MSEDSDVEKVSSVIDDELISKVLTEHLDAASQFAELGQYRRITIQANRMITDSALLSENPSLVLPGLVLRLAAIELESRLVGPRGAVELPLKKAVTGLLSNLKNCIDRPDAEKPWQAYSDFYREFWNSLRAKTEGRGYSRNQAFVNALFDWHFSKLGEWAEDLGKERGLPLDGIVNELARVIRAHGCSERQLASLGALQVLLWWSQYVIWSSVSGDGRIDRSAVSQKAVPRIKELIEVYNVHDASYYQKLSSTCKKNLTEWRSDFIRYYDLYLQQESRLRAFIEPIEAPDRSPGRNHRRERSKEQEEE